MTFLHLRSFLLSGSALLFIFAGSAPVLAQNIPGSADPSRFVPRAEDLSQKVKNAKTSVKNRIAEFQISEKDARKTYRMDALVVEGLTVYSPESLSRPNAHLMGRFVTLDTIYGIAENLQQRYWDDGYALTKVIVPEQKDGTIRLQVIEGYIAEVETKGVNKNDKVMADAVRRLNKMGAVNVKKLERLMLIVNDMPGTKASAVLATPKQSDLPLGAVRIVLEQSEAPRITASAGVNNFGSNYSGPWQASGSAAVAHLFQPHDNLSFTTAFARPVSELAYGSLAYDVALCGASGLKLSLNTMAAQNEPGEDLEEFDVKGRSREVSAALSYPVIRQRDKTWRIEGAFAYKYSRTDFAGDRLYDDRLRVVSLGSSYVFADRLSGLNAFETSLSQGLDILGSRESGSPDLSREDGRSDFTKLTAMVGRQQPLPGSFVFYAVAEGQYTDDPLFSGEEFGFGGSRTGRGYDPSEITGDRGFSVSLELRHVNPLKGGNATLQPYAFYDVGKVWNVDPSDRNTASAASTGVGLKFSHIKGWNSDLNFSVPLTREVAQPPKYSSANGPRVLFSLNHQF